MADIVFKCPHCGQKLESPPEMVGKILDCPACQNKINIPNENKTNKKNWRDDPATEAQLKLLESFYIKPAKPITKGEASNLIDNAIEKDLPRAEKAIDYAKEKSETRKEITSLKKKIANSTLNSEIQTAEEKLKSASLSENDRKDLIEELGELKFEKEELQEKLDDALEDLENIIESEKSDKDEEKEYMNDRVEEALEGFSPGGKYNPYMKKPTKKQIKQVLEVLDEEFPDWEQKGDEPIFATLQVNFPELLKKTHSPKSKGCLSIVLLISAISSIVIYLIL